MKINDTSSLDFEFDEEFKARAFELLDESQALQFAEGLRLGSALSNLHAREYERLAGKYGKDHPRTLEMSDRILATEGLKKDLFFRYTDAATPYFDPGEGWAVDGFVRNENGDPVSGVTVAAYDRQERWCKEFGHGCTDKRGYFSIVVEKIPESPSPVYMRASRDKELLTSNEVQLVPKPKSTDRVEIIIGDVTGTGDCSPPAGNEVKVRPPEVSIAEKIRPVRRKL